MGLVQSAAASADDGAAALIRGLEGRVALGWEEASRLVAAGHGTVEALAALGAYGIIVQSQSGGGNGDAGGRGCGGDDGRRWRMRVGRAREVARAAAEVAEEMAEARKAAAAAATAPPWGRRRRRRRRWRRWRRRWWARAAAGRRRRRRRREAQQPRERGGGISDGKSKEEEKEKAEELWAARSAAAAARLIDAGADVHWANPNSYVHSHARARAGRAWRRAARVGSVRVSLSRAARVRGGCGMGAAAAAGAAEGGGTAA